jgi:c-di-GMP-binding flagellar brake protein YcgR
VGTAAEESRYLVAGDNHHLAATDERRRHARVRVYGRVQFSSGDKTLSANLVNVSQGGVHLVVPDSRSLLGFGRELEPPLLLEDDVSKSRIRLDVASSVTWNEDVGTGARLGVVFAELDSEQVERIRAFVATVGAEPSS